MNALPNCGGVNATVSIRLINEVLDHAPAELTPVERLLLVALAEKANDLTRRCWPGMELLTKRLGVGERRVRQVLTELATRGYELRVPAGCNKRGEPVFATRGHRTVYEIPTFGPKGGSVLPPLEP